MTDNTKRNEAYERYRKGLSENSCLKKKQRFIYIKAFQITFITKN